MQCVSRISAIRVLRLLVYLVSLWCGLLPHGAHAQTGLIVDQLQLQPTTHAALSLAPLTAAKNGAVVYCADCIRGSDPCLSGGTGGHAQRVGDAWSCAIGKTGVAEKAVSKYASLNATITAAAAGDTILIDAATTVTTSVTVPATVRLQWRGCHQITISAAQTLTVVSALDGWPQCQLFTGAGAIPGVSFAGNVGKTAISPLWWGANGTDASDDSNAFNYAGNAAFAGSVARGSLIKIPGGKYIAANILLRHGVQWEGIGPGSTTHEGTQITQLATSDDPIFITDAAGCAANIHTHWVQVRNLRLVGDKGTNTLGSGVHFNCATGELVKLENLMIEDFPQHGIYFGAFGTNLNGEDLSLFENDGAGLYIDTQGGTIGGLNLCHFEDISGDNNGEALIHYHPPGTPEASCSFTNIKAETSQSGRQPDVFVLDNINGTPVHIDNVSAFVGAGFTLNSIVRNTSTSTARIFGKLWRAGGSGTTTNLIDDDNSSLALPYTGNTSLFHFAWFSTGGTIYKVDSTGLVVKNLFNGGVATQAGVSYTMVAADENRLLVFNRATAMPITLPVATTVGFTAGAVFPVYNRGAGTVTITPTTSTINGAATLVLLTGQGAQIVSDGTNYSAWVSQASPAGVQTNLDTHAALTNPHGATTNPTPGTLELRDASGGTRQKFTADTLATLPTCTSANIYTETYFIEGIDAQDCGQTGGGTVPVKCGCNGTEWVAEGGVDLLTLDTIVANSGSPATLNAPADGLRLVGFNSLTKSFRVCDTAGTQCMIFFCDDSGVCSISYLQPVDEITKLSSGKFWELKSSADASLLKITDAGVISGDATTGVDPTAVRVLNKNTTDVSIASSATETVIYVFSLPANTLGTDKCVRVTLSGSLLQNTGVAQNPAGTLRVRFGGTAGTLGGTPGSGGTTAPSLASPSVNTSSTAKTSTITAQVCNDGATNAQRTWGRWETNAVVPGSTQSNSAIDTTATVPIEVTMQLGVSDAALTYTHEYAITELLP